MIRLALIGCGGHAATGHAEPLHLFATRNPGVVTLAACCDIYQERAEAFCRQYGFGRAYADWQTMLEAEKPDAVVCAVPIAQTVPIGVTLLRRGVPCLLEKPPGATLAEMATLVQAARETNTLHLISVNRRFNPFLNRALAWAEEIGPILHVHGRMLRHNRRDEEFVWGTGVHIVDTLRYIGGECDSLDCDTIGPPRTSAPWFFVRMRFASGGTGTMEIAPTAGMIEETYDLYGEGFRASVTTLGGAGEGVTFWRNGKREREEHAPPEAPVCLRDGCYEETTAFIQALQQGVTLRPGVQDIAPTMELCARIQPEMKHDHTRLSMP